MSRYQTENTLIELLPTLINRDQFTVYDVIREWPADDQRKPPTRDRLYYHLHRLKKLGRLRQLASQRNYCAFRYVPEPEPPRSPLHAAWDEFRQTGELPARKASTQ